MYFKYLFLLLLSVGEVNALCPIEPSNEPVKILSQQSKQVLNDVYIQDGITVGDEVVKIGTIQKNNLFNAIVTINDLNPISYKTDQHYFPLTITYVGNEQGFYLVGGWKSKGIGNKQLPWLVKFQDNKFIKEEIPLSQPQGTVKDIITIESGYYLLSLYSQKKTILILKNAISNETLWQCKSDEIISFPKQTTSNLNFIDISYLGKQGKLNLENIELENLEQYEFLYDGLVAYYPFNGNAKDASGNGNNGIVNGATLTEDKFENVGSAYSFDGIDDYIKINNFEIDSDKDFTFSLWVTPKNLNKTAILFNKEDVYELAIFAEKCDLRKCDNDEPIRNKEFAFAVRKDWDWYSMNHAASENQIYSIVMVYDSINNRVLSYINGALTSTDNLGNGTSSVRNNFLCIGSRGNCNESYFTGNLDNIRIYNRTLSDSEVQQLYTLENSGLINKLPKITPRSCNHALALGINHGDGTYMIDPDGEGGIEPFEVYCDMTTDGGGWTLIKYTKDLPVMRHYTDRDGWRWLNEPFQLQLTNEQIKAIQAVSREGKQLYVGQCQHVIHYKQEEGNNFIHAFGFRFLNHEETPPAVEYKTVDYIKVTKDECGKNDNVKRETWFQIQDIRVPIINVYSLDNGDVGEIFGSPLTQYPARLR